MIVGVNLRNFGPLAHRDAVLAVALAAEELGYASLWTSDHVVLPTDMTSLSDPADDHYDPTGALLESLVTLAFVAGRTSTIRLGTSVLVLPQRELHLVAKQVATLHHLSGERLLLGVGVGWVEREYALVGADYAHRGEVADEHLVALRTLLETTPPVHHGRRHDFDDVLFAPRPVVGVPLLVGGDSPPALRRAARYGDGWHAYGLSPAEIEAGLATIRQHGARSDFEVSLRIRTRLDPAPPAGGGDVGTLLEGSTAQVVDAIGRYEQAGVAHLVVDLGTPDPASYVEQLEAFAADVVPQLSPG